MLVSLGQDNKNCSASDHSHDKNCLFQGRWFEANSSVHAAAALFGTIGDGSNKIEQKIMMGHNRSQRVMTNWAHRDAVRRCIAREAAALL
jgi:hypothetical protein